MDKLENLSINDLIGRLHFLEQFMWEEAGKEMGDIQGELHSRGWRRLGSTNNWVQSEEK